MQQSRLGVYLAWLFFVAMLIATVIANHLKPETKLGLVLSPVSLNQMVPAGFSVWSEIPENTSNIVNPELSDTLSRTYDQILTRFYVDQGRSIVMLSIAYGENQIDEGALHLPEICYPAQGLMLDAAPATKQLSTPYGKLELKQFVARQPGRVESVSYWTMMGNHRILGALPTKVQQIRYGLQGYIPDGLLFRVSMIHADPKHAFQIQEKFIIELISALQAQDRQRLTGLGVN